MRKISLLVFLLLLTGFSIAQNIKVLSGIEVLKKNDFNELKGLKIGLITNQTGVDNFLNTTIDLLYKTKNVDLVCLFGPEHGVRGDVPAGKKIKSYIDEYTGLKVYSLYGSTRKPTREMLKGLDALVYDIQDIGCRSYTYISTMGLAMEAAAENNLKFFVLDRPNPLGGERIEGNLPEEGFNSFISQYNIPYIYGLTCGELANLINGEKWLAKNIQCDLTVIKMENWNRSMTFDDCGLLWIPTSPHIPNIKTVLFYPATGIIGELRDSFNNGVGYTLPFQMILAENLDAKKIAAMLNNKYQNSDIIYRATSITPYYTGFKGKNLKGVQIHFLNKEIKNLMMIQFYVLENIVKLDPELLNKLTTNKSQLRMFNLALGTNKIIEFIQKDQFEKIEKYLIKDVKNFRELSSKYHLY